MGMRHTGRERALQALYLLEHEPGTLAEVALDTSWTALDDGELRDPDAFSFALQLVHGVREHLAAIDALLDEFSHNWRVARMQRIDRNVLRLGVYELLHLPEIPRRVTINEAIELGKAFGNEDSSAFINGLLDRVATQVGKP